MPKMDDILALVGDTKALTETTKEGVLATLTQQFGRRADAQTLDSAADMITRSMVTRMQALIKIQETAHRALKR